MSGDIQSAYSNNPTYALRRLKRDRPDLAEKVIAGELSANGAAIEQLKINENRGKGFPSSPLTPRDAAHHLHVAG